MKLTITQLKKIISEEVKNVILHEDASSATSSEGQKVTAALAALVEEIEAEGPEASEDPKTLILDVLKKFLNDNNYE